MLKIEIPLFASSKLRKKEKKNKLCKAIEFENGKFLEKNKVPNTVRDLWKSDE